MIYLYILIPAIIPLAALSTYPSTPVNCPAKNKLGYLFVRKGVKDMKETMDYKSVGGAMLLGVNGIVVKGHGSSDAYSFRCALDLARRMANAEVVKNMKEGLEENEKN